MSGVPAALKSVVNEPLLRPVKFLVKVAEVEPAPFDACVTDNTSDESLKKSYS